MEQIKDMKRLLYKNKVAGFEKREIEFGSLHIFHNINNTVGWLNIRIGSMIKHDSYEQGILMPDGEWRFPGDLFSRPKDDVITICHDNEDGFSASYVNKEFPEICLSMGSLTWEEFLHIIKEYKFKYIGNIHEEKYNK